MVGSLKSGAGERIRTVNIHLGKVVLYQLSYAREWTKIKPRGSLAVKHLRLTLADHLGGGDEVGLAKLAGGLVGKEPGNG